MRRLTRLAAVTAGLLSLFALASTSASAITWDNLGDTAFSATAGSPTFSTTGLLLGCASAQLSGTAPIATGTATLTVSATGSYLGCTFAGSAMGIECNYKFTGVNQDGATVTGSTDVTCGLYIANSKLCHLSGSRPSTYQNPSGSATGVLTLSTSSLLVVGSPCPIGNNDLVEFSPQVFRINGGTGGPLFTRTP